MRVLVCCDYLDFDGLFSLILDDAGHSTAVVARDELAAALGDHTVRVVVTATAIGEEHPVRISRRLRPDVRIVVMSTWSLSTARDHLPEADVSVECDGSHDLPARLVAAVASPPTGRSGASPC